MTPLSERCVGAALWFLPGGFRGRFRAEMLTAFHDQRVALRETAAMPRMATLWLTVRTVAGLTRSLPAIHLDEQRRLARIPNHHGSRSTRMEKLVTDIRYAVRTLRKQPGFAAVAILTLALGIGANTAVFSVLNSVVIAPLPYNDSDRLVRLYAASEESPTDRQFLGGLNLLDVRDQVSGFESMGIMYTYQEEGYDLTSDGPPQRIRVLQINADYFRTLGATPLMGRVFQPDEEQPDIPRVILSHGLWVSILGRDEKAVGRDIELDGASYEIIGVMRPTFTDVVVGDVAAWVPLNLVRGGRNSRGNHYLSAIARLAPGVSVAQAQAQVDRTINRIKVDFPDSNQSRILRVLPLHGDIVGESRAPVYILMGAAGLVLLIACLNVASLFLARSVTQTRENAIRTALGASRSRVIVQRLTESLMVAVAGGMVGSFVAYAGVKFLLAVSPESLARAEEVGFDPALLSFALIITVFTGVVFGAAPAYRASHVDPNEALREGARGNTGGVGGRGARNVLVASQVSLALILLVGAGILIRGFTALQKVELGFDAESVATFEVHLPLARYGEPEERVRFHHRFQDRLESLSGVRSVAATSWLPANGPYHQWGYGYLDDAGERQWTDAMIRVIEGDYFETLGIALQQGRAFTRDDRVEADAVALINQTLATRVYGESDPVGDLFWTGGDEFRVIGVVSDVAHEADGTSMHKVYLSHGQFAADRNWGLTYVVKTSTDPRSITGLAQVEMSSLDRALVVHQPRTMAAVLSRHRARDQFTLLLMVVFATVAVSLAAVGVYGVLSYTLSQRTHEVGVRMALGAQARQVRAIIMKHGVRVAGIGMLIGMAGAYWLSRFLESIVFGVSTRDPAVFITVALVLAVVVVLAGYVPARRATQVDPLDSLRSD